MFWGLIMEPQRRYTQQVKKAFHISMASLDISTSSEEPAQVMCSFEGRNYLLCTLRKPDVLQCPLDLNFEVGSELSFAANGKCHVHLTGYLIDEPISDDLDGLEEEEEEEDVEEDETVVNNKKRSKKEQKNGPPAKKNKGNNAKKSDADSDSDKDSDDSDVDIKEFLEKSLGDSEDDTTFRSEDQDEESGEEEEDDDDEDIEEEDEDDVEGEEDEEDEESSLSEAESEEEKEIPSPKKKNKQVNGIAKPEQAKSKKDKNQQPQQDQKDKGKKESTSPAPKRKVLNGGVIIEDIKEGDGAPAKAGKFVTVYYEGRLKQNNKVFDSTKKGAGFSFRLGAGEVIKGWDVGVLGMKPGSKRRIICPPAMAYGQKGSPPAIPANSTLVFEVELKKIR